MDTKTGSMYKDFARGNAGERENREQGWGRLGEWSDCNANLIWSEGEGVRLNGSVVGCPEEACVSQVQDYHAFPLYYLWL